MSETKNKPSKGLVVLFVVVVLGGIGQLVGTDEGSSQVQSGADAAPRAQPDPPEPVSPPEPSPSQPAKPSTPAVPTDQQMAIDAAFFEAQSKRPNADNYKRVARRLKLDSDEVLEALSLVAEYRAALLEQASGPVKGVVGSLDIKNVTRTDLGTHTALVSLTATGCPGGDPRRDKDLQFLATKALTKLAQQLPQPIDSYRAALWYRGLSCGRGSTGYGATWTRAGNKLTLE